MSVPTAELTAPAPPTDVAAPRRGLPEWVRGGRFYLWLAGFFLLGVAGFGEAVWVAGTAPEVD